VLDGYVARLNRVRQSRLGGDLDSLADVISFGVAPAILGFTLGLRGGWDMLLLTTLHHLALMYAVSGSAMVSATLRIPKL
jgi:phosphatidylserine synthase